jgi:hypothetical protein
MELNKTNKGLFAIAALSAIVYLAYMNIYKKSDDEKRVGENCKFKEGEPEGKIVFDFPYNMTAQNIPAPTSRCKRCNQTGCSTTNI